MRGFNAPIQIGSGWLGFGFDQLTHAKSILIAPPDKAIDHLYPPCSEDKIKALDQWHVY
jgi:aldehyde dehydrogenase (NAD+)